MKDKWRVMLSLDQTLIIQVGSQIWDGLESSSGLIQTLLAQSLSSLKNRASYQGRTNLDKLEIQILAQINRVLGIQSQNGFHSHSFKNKNYIRKPVWLIFENEDKGCKNIWEQQIAVSLFDFYSGQNTKEQFFHQ